MTAHVPQIRIATPADAPTLAGLLTQLGYPTTPDDLHERITSDRLDGSTDVVLVACLDQVVVGVGSVHAIPMLQRAGSVARLTAFVVDERARRAGIGTALLHACEMHARRFGAERMEVTSGDQREGAHAFYGGRGYAREGQRFTRSLSRDRE